MGVQHGGSQMQVNDCISNKNTNRTKITLLSFLKVYLYGCSVSHKISGKHFLRIACTLHLKFIKVDMNFRNSFQIIFIFFEERLFQYERQYKHIHVEWNEIHNK